MTMKLLLLLFFIVSTFALPQIQSQKCHLSGCAGEICSSKPEDQEYTFCLWKPENACYSKSTAVCGLLSTVPQAKWTVSPNNNVSDICGWIWSEELVACLKSKDSGSAGVGPGNGNGTFEIGTETTGMLASPTPVNTGSSSIKSSGIQISSSLLLILFVALLL